MVGQASWKERFSAAMLVRDIAASSATWRAKAARAASVVALALSIAGMSHLASAEGSRTLFPEGYLPGETGNTNPTAVRSDLFYNASNTYMGIIRQRNFFYVYARQGEYILLGTSGQRSALRLFSPPSTGQSLEQRFGTPGMENAGALSGNVSLSGSGCSNNSANIGSRAAELAGPNSANNTVTVPSGYVPCWYQATETGIHGVFFGAASIERWDVTVRDSATSTTDLSGRLFSYAFAGDTGNASDRTYATHYYITDDGYRYSQTFRGLAPYQYVLYSNPQGFLDVNGDPLYKNVRGGNHWLSTQSSSSYFRPVGTGIQAQRPTYPMFFSDVVHPSVDTVDGLQATLGALNIPTTPAHPVALSASFSNSNLTGSRTYLGQGGVFTISTENALSYQILIKGGNTAAHDDPAHPDNRVLTGLATGLNQQVFWDGRTNAGAPMPAGGNYTFEATGRAGEVHFPFLDAEGNLSGGPSVTRLNGVGAGEATVYYDDRGYTTNGVDVGVPNGNICGASGPSNTPSPSYSLLGVDSNDADLNSTGKYYRSWGAAPNTGNTGNDCAASGFYGDGKGMDLWALIRSSPPPGVLTVEILDRADVTTDASIQASVAPGGTATIAMSFGNVGSSAASDVTYSVQLIAGLTGVGCTGASCQYNSATGLVTISGLPVSLSPGQWTHSIDLQYTAPASGAITATVQIATSSTQTLANAPDSASGLMTVEAVGTSADVVAQVNAPLAAAASGAVNVAVTFRNLGPLSANGVAASMTLPADLSGVSCSAPLNCSYSSTTGAVTVTGLAATLAADSAVTTVLSYTAPASGAVSVSATISTTTLDSVMGNNTASATTMISSEVVADVTAAIESPSQVLGSAVMDIAMVFRNLGPQVATGVTYAATLPSGLTGVSCAAPYGCSYDGTTGVLTITGMPTSLVNGQSATLSVQLTAPATGTLSFAASIGTATAESNALNNAVSAQTLVTPATHTVTFDSNGGSAVAPIDVAHGGTITAPTPPVRPDYAFDGWYSNSGLTIAWSFATDTVTSPTTLYGRWLLLQYTLTYTAGPNGSISGTTPQTVNHGANGSQVTATPSAGYHFVSWSDGVTTAARTDTSITGNLSVTATFAINQYTLTYMAGANGSISGTTPQTVDHGANGAQVTATPNAGYHFVSWSDGVTTAARVDTNITSNRSVTATFAINQYTLTYTAGANGSISGTTSQTVNHGGNATAVIATPNTGYHFVSWSDGVTTAARTDTNITSDRSVTATFAINQYTLTYTAGANGSISGTTSQTVNHGANGSPVTATPSAGYHFVSWSDGVTTAARTDTNITSNRSVTATFAINQYTLTYAAGANGSISGTTSQTVNHGGNATAVAATPNTGYHFVSWSDGVTTAARTDTNITSNRSVTATFTINQYTLTYAAGANGSISGTTSQTVNHGGNATAVTATPNTGYHFVSWSDGVTTAARTDTNITSNRSVTATFAINQYTLTYTAGANGSISGTTPQTVNHGGNGSQVTATPSTGYHFVSWSDGVTTAARTDTNVTSNRSVTATFAINGYTVTYTAGANGSITGTSPQTVNHGGNATAVTATPNTGYHFVSWSDGVTTAARTDTNITSNRSVTATFAINQYTLTYTAGANGSISGTTPQTVNHGGNGSQVDATPNTGYHFVSWSDGVTTAARTDTNITSNRSVTATFAINGYTVTYTAGANGSITGTSPQTVNHGGNATAVTATPNTGYHFVSWSDGVTTAARTDTNITSNRSVTATFAINGYTVTYTAGANGSITGTSPQTVNHGGNATAVTATPSTGYHFASWSDGVTTAARTDTNITSDRSVTATFAINQYTLTYAAGANGSISGTTPQTVGHGGNGSVVTARPAPGYRFVSWSDGSTSASRSEVDVQSDLAVSANFGLGSIATEEYTVAHGSEQSFTMPSETTLTNVRRIRGGQQSAIDDPTPADYADILECQGAGCRFLGARSGRYELTFTDGSGNTSIYAFVVHPNVGYAIERQSGRQAVAATVRVVLDDLPVAEEVRVAYSIQNEAAIHLPEPSDLLTRNPRAFVLNVGAGGTMICFESGRCEQDIVFTPNVPSGEVQFGLHASEGVAIGNFSTHTVVVQPATMVPMSAELVMLPGHTVTVGTPVVAGVVGLPPGNYSFDWSQSDNATGIGSNTSDATSPQSTSLGQYVLRVTIRDLDHPNRPAITLETWLRVVQGSQSAAMCGAQGCDDDGTRIPVSQQVPECGLGVNDPGQALAYRLQVGAKNQAWDNTGLCLETLPGYGMRLGTISFLSSPTYGAGLETGAIRRYGNRGLEARNATDYTHSHPGVQYDFEIVGLTQAGASAAVVVPMPRNLTIPAEAVWRKFDAVGGWSDFVTNTANTLHSANRIGAECPSVVSPLWDANPGLVTGMQCVRLVIQDGGSNDHDGQANGVIAKTGALGVRAGGHKVTSSDRKGGGGAIGPFWLVIAAVMFVWRTVRSRIAVAFIALVCVVPFSVAEDRDEEGAEIRHTGLFIGATGAYALGEVGSEEVTRGLQDHGIPLSAQVEDQNRFAWRVFGGYRFADHLSIDVAYANLGIVTTYIDGNPIDLEDVPYVLPASGAGPELSLAGYLPVGERWDLYARVGMWRWEALYHLRETGQKRRPKASGIDALGAIGARYWLSSRWQTGVSYERYRIDTQNVDLVGLSVVYQFGSRRKTESTMAPLPSAPAQAPVAPPQVQAPAPQPAPPPEPAPAPVAAPIVAPAPAPVFKVNFGFDSAAITADAMRIIDEAASFLRDHPDYRVDVSGHTDLLGSSQYNMRLSMRRAEAVAAALAARGVERDRMSLSARGLHEPLAGELDEDARAADRRVHITPVRQ